jgi:peptidyl-prolyl cis-trans isomerase B (cyclophilin B)
VTRPRIAALALLPLLLLAGCGSASKNPSANTTNTSGPCHYAKDGTKAAKPVQLPPSTPDQSNPASMVISTSAGDIPVTFEAGSAPCTVNSFVSLARQGYFDRTPCHRLTTQGYYVLQCGDPMGTGQGGPGYTFADELVQNDPRLQPCGNEQGQAFCTYNTGTVAMANRGPNTNGSQFFLVYGNSRFPPDYTVFGHLDAAGLKVIKAIAAKGVAGSGGMGPGDGAPKEPVTITSVK